MSPVSGGKKWAVQSFHQEKASQSITCDELITQY